MVSELNRLLALVGLIGFFVACALALLRVHRAGGSASRARIEQLICNRYGEMDPVLCAFWLGVGTLVWGLVYCTLKGRVPEGIGLIYGIFAANVTTPLVMKVVFKAKSPPEVPPEKE